MTCGEFLRVLEMHPDAELVFEQYKEPNNGHGRLVKVMNNLELWSNDHIVRVTYDPFNKNE